MNMKQECVNSCITMVCGVYNMKVFPDILKKVKMVCPCIRDECDQNCEVFKNIPEIKAADQEWHMRDER